MDAALLAALMVIDNVLRHEPGNPPYAPPMVRELLAQPREALDAESIFRRAVPAALVDQVNHPPQAPSRPFPDLLDAYIGELKAIQLDFHAAVQPFDELALVRRLDDGLVSADQLLRAGAAVDAAKLERVNARFVEATLRFAHAARKATRFPEHAVQIDSPIGLISIGTLGNDRHGPEAALIVDPGGDDIYERRPATGGAISVIVDLGGNDRYAGSDVAVRGLSAIVDFDGDDRYEMQGAGLGAAIAGASLLIDYAGNDHYQARHFGQGAAAFGLGALVDGEGNDRYRLRAWGQGLGLAGGVGLLWDRGGDDDYEAAGEPDPFERGGGLSGAQGVAFGFRTMLGGGTGILRDESGNDRYQAELFAQGTGYYRGIGLLWDERGDDRYQATRYAQGSGAHEAIGILRDEAGNDLYQASFGVGQGMGLDLALGVLFDGGGDDVYSAGLLAQGTATANGIGLLADAGGTDRFEIGQGPRNWGHAERFRRLPSVGLFELNSRSVAFVLAGQSLEKAPAALPREEQPAPTSCKPASPDKLRDAIGTLRLDHFDAVLAVGEDLRCSTDWPLMRELLEKKPGSPLALWIGFSLLKNQQRDEIILRHLDSHPSCEVRAVALEARGSREAAEKALGSSCWRLRATAEAMLRER